MRSDWKDEGFNVFERIRCWSAIAHLLRNGLILLIAIIPKFLLCYYVKAILLRRIFNAGDERSPNVTLFKSGRAAISGLLYSLRAQEKRVTVFVPDYICNVVEQACEDAGFKIRRYATDINFSPVWNDLRHILQQDDHGVLLVASMFGSVPITSDEMRRVRLEFPNLFIVADECQNLVENSTVMVSLNQAIVFSFNDKTCPGIMGGGVIFSAKQPINMVFKKRSIRSRIQNGVLFFMIFGKRVVFDFCHIVKIFMGIGKSYCVQGGYEYSSCESYHYNTHPDRIHRVSVAYALVSLSLLKHYSEIRRENIVSVFGASHPMVSSKTASSYPPFLPLVGVKPTRVTFPVPVKSPYAMQSDRTLCRFPVYALKFNVPYVKYSKF